jgi:hypothetical protein
MHPIYRTVVTLLSIYLCIYSTNIFNDFLDLLAPSPFIPPQNVVYFTMLPSFFLGGGVHKIFTFYINGVLKFKRPAPGPKGWDRNLHLSPQLKEASYSTIHFCSLLTAIFPKSMYPLHSFSHIIRVMTNVVRNLTPVGRQIFKCTKLHGVISKKRYSSQWSPWESQIPISHY